MTPVTKPPPRADQLRIPVSIPVATVCAVDRGTHESTTYQVTIENEDPIISRSPKERLSSANGQPIFHCPRRFECERSGQRLSSIGLTNLVDKPYAPKLYLRHRQDGLSLGVGHDECLKITQRIEQETR